MFFVPGGNAQSTSGKGGEAGKAGEPAKGAKSDMQKAAERKAAGKAAKAAKAGDKAAKNRAKKAAKKSYDKTEAAKDKQRRLAEGENLGFRDGGMGESGEPTPPKVKKPKVFWAAFVAKDPDGNPIPGLDYEASDADGAIHKGQTGPDGSVRIENLPAGFVKVKFPALLTQVPAFDLKLKEPPKKKAAEAKAPAPAPKKPPPPEEPPKKPAPKKPLPWKSAPPPRDGHTIKNDDAREEAWFPKLAPTKWEDLQAGDILIRKTFGEHVNRTMQGSFFLLYGPKGGSPMTIECGLLLEDGTVARMSAVAGKAIAEKPTFGNWLAFRPMDPAVAQKAVETAQWLLTQKVGWSITHLMDAPELGGIKDAKKADPAAIKARKLPRPNMHEGEWLMHVLQSAVEKGLDVPGSVYTPGRVEQRLNDSIYKLFTFVGSLALGADDAEHESKWRDAVKASGRPAKRVESHYKNPSMLFMGMGDFVGPYLKLWPPPKKK